LIKRIINKLLQAHQGRNNNLYILLYLSMHLLHIYFKRNVKIFNIYSA